MSRKARCQYILEKSVHAALSAIEIYNKPDFKYREESFSPPAPASLTKCNSWYLIKKYKFNL